MHDLLMSNYFAQTKVLAFGKTADEIADEGVDPHVVPHKVMPGNRPSTSILAPELTPSVIGQLIALYEHQVFVEGTIWGINPFDQWGVELGKTQAMGELLGSITDSLPPAALGDSSTDGKCGGIGRGAASRPEHSPGCGALTPVGWRRTPRPGCHRRVPDRVARCGPSALRSGDVGDQRQRFDGAFGGVTTDELRQRRRHTVAHGDAVDPGRRAPSSKLSASTASAMSPSTRRPSPPRGWPVARGCRWTRRSPRRSRRRPHRRRPG